VQQKPTSSPVLPMAAIGVGGLLLGGGGLWLIRRRHASA